MSLFRIYIELTTGCGLRCDFCPPHKQSGAVMGLGDFERVAAQAAGLTREIALHVMGDPLLVENLGEYLQVASRYRLRVYLVTSGSMIRAEHYDLLLHPAIYQVNFSLASFAANAQKRTLGSYLDPLIAFAHLASRANRPFVNFRLWGLDETAQGAAFDGVVRDYLSGCFEICDHGSYYQLAPWVRLVYDRRFEWPDLNAKPLAKEGRCHGAKSQLAVLSDGRIVPCCLDAQGSIELGHMDTDTLFLALKGVRASRMREGFERGELIETLCQRCGYRMRFDTPKER